ncbi:MAG TPA: ROK family transcriptional regulator, partial [Anaerolineae bacterium]|nr:ROK family transcriptional regulator [Anaerolineae bacterium]
MATLRTGNRELIRRINQNLLLNLVRMQGPISRAELAKRTQLSPATVTYITQNLLDRGLVHVIGPGSSNGGRRPELLKLEPRAGFVVGVKLSADTIATAVTDLEATVLHYTETPYELADTAAPTIRALIRRIEQALHRSGVDKRKVLGIGIGMGGLMDNERGVCRFSPILNWREVQVAAPLREYFDIPVFLDNDVNTLTLAEKWFGHGKGIDNFVVITVGRGVGMGIVTNGQFYRGAQGGAGEIGHITVKPNGPLCDCGKRGCLEALTSDPAVIAQVHGENLKRFKSQDKWTLDDIVDAATRGDMSARRALTDAGHWLGIGVANVVNL